MSDNQASEWADAQDKLNDELNKPAYGLFKNGEHVPGYELSFDEITRLSQEAFDAGSDNKIVLVPGFRDDKMNDERIMGIDLASGPDHTAIMHEDNLIARIRDGKVIEDE